MTNNVTFHDHTADIQMHVWAPQKEELFYHVLAGLQIIMGVACTNHTISQVLFVEASCFENLFVDTLSEIITLQAVNHATYNTITIIKYSDTMLSAVLHGCNAVRGTGVEIKAVTYHGLSIYYKDGMWHAFVIFDI